MTDPFELLGVERRFSLDRAALEQRHRDLSRTLHPDRYVQSPPGERRMALERAVAVNEAFRALRDPLTRAEALLSAHGLAVGDAERPSQSLLMEVMELQSRSTTPGARPRRSPRCSTRCAPDRAPRRHRVGVR